MQVPFQALCASDGHPYILTLIGGLHLNEKPRDAKSGAASWAGTQNRRREHRSRACFTRPSRYASSGLREAFAYPAHPSTPSGSDYVHYQFVRCPIFLPIGESLKRLPKQKKSKYRKFNIMANIHNFTSAA